MKNIILIAVLFVFQHQIKAQNETVETWYIGDTKRSCALDSTITSCYIYKLHQDSAWKYWPYEIKNFEYELGNDYEINVVKRPVLIKTSSQEFEIVHLNTIKKTKTLITDVRILANNKWNIINIDKGGKQQFAKKANANIVFDVEKENISAFMGCNSGGGKANYTDGVIEFGILQSTLLDCDKIEIEKSIYDALKGKAAFYVRNKMLYIVGENFTTLHLRPTNSLDSIIKVINEGNIAGIVRENSLKMLVENLYQVNLILGGTGFFSGVYNSTDLTPDEKKLYSKKLTPQINDQVIKHVYIKKTTKKDYNYSMLVIYQDGQKENIDF
jgi:heat shock protein HslJ